MADPIMAILVPPGTQAEIQEEHATTAAILDQLRAWPCETPQDEADLAEILSAVKAKTRDLEEKRTTITGPLNAAKRAVDALFRPAKDALAEAERIIKGKLAEADKRREAKRRAQLQAASEAAARAREAAAQGDTVTAMAATQEAHQAVQAAPTAGSSAAPEGISFRYVWKWDLVDINRVPAEFLALNPATLRIYVERYKHSDTIPEVPGITFRRERIVVSRAG